MSSRKWGANSRPIGDYPPIEVAEVTQWKETFSAIDEGAVSHAILILALHSLCHSEVLHVCHVLHPWSM